jgi:hypothetical protein
VLQKISRGVKYVSEGFTFWRFFMAREGFHIPHRTRASRPTADIPKEERPDGIVSDSVAYSAKVFGWMIIIVAVVGVVYFLVKLFRR